MSDVAIADLGRCGPRHVATSEPMSWMGVGASSPKWQSLPPVIIAGGNGRRVSSSCLRSPWALLQCPDFTDNLILPSGNLLHSY